MSLLFLEKCKYKLNIILHVSEENCNDGLIRPLEWVNSYADDYQRNKRIALFCIICLYALKHSVLPSFKVFIYNILSPRFMSVSREHMWKNTYSLYNVFKCPYFHLDFQMKFQIKRK